MVDKLYIVQNSFISIPYNSISTYRELNARKPVLFLETFDMVGCYKLNTIEGVFILCYMKRLYHGAR